jgi:hypothetical protein
MEVLRRYVFGEVKAAKSLELFERVLAALSSEARQRGRMLIEDGPRSVSAIDRAIKRYPELERYRLASCRSDGITGQILSSIDVHHVTAKPCGFVSPETLMELVRGFPRSYPFWQADFFFTTGLPWQATSEPERLLPAAETWNLFAEPIPRLAFRLNWRPSGYRAAVHAVRSLGDAAMFDRALPPLADAATTCLATFGKPRTGLMLRRTDDESALLVPITARLSALHEEWSDRSTREMATLALPHALPVNGTGTQYYPLMLSHKASLLAAFQPRGYRYSSANSGNGSFELHKRTPNRNRIAICFDVGTTSRRYSGDISVRGIRGFCCAPLPAHPEQASYSSYDVGSDDAWQKIVENLAVLTDHLEQVFVPEVDDVLGQTPDWYEW